MDWAGDVAVTVRLGHINDEHSVDVCFVVIGCEMVEISAKVRVSPDQEADLIVNER